MQPLFSIRNLTVRYGPVTAVHNFNLDVAERQIVGLIGPNGAGKTSLIDALTGFAPCSGSVRFNDVEISRMSAHRRVRLGVARSWQSLELFDDLTVLENLMVSTGPSRTSGSNAGTSAGVAEALHEVGLGDVGHLLPTQLSQGQRKLLSLARALATQPRVLLADEPAAGLDTTESQVLGQRLRAISEGGVGILLVDHDMGLVLSICDHIYVIDFGNPLADGPPAVIRQHPAVIEAYLGGGHRVADDEHLLLAVPEGDSS